MRFSLSFHRALVPALFGVVIGWFLFAQSGCKNKDEQPPALSLDSPAVNATLSGTATDLLRIEGSATDNQELASISILLTNELGGIEGSENIGLSGTSDNFDFNFQLGNEYSPTGNYTLRIRVSDASGNVDTRFFQISISELPLELFNVVVGVRDANDDYFLYRLDSAGNILDGPVAAGANLAALEIDSRQDIVLSGTRTTGIFNGYRADDLSLIFSESIPGGANGDAITDLSISDGEYYVSSEFQPYVRLFSPQGTQLSSLNMITQPAQHIAVSDNLLFAGVESLVGSSQKIDCYRISSRSLLGIYVTDYPNVELLVHRQSHVAALGNDIGNGVGAELFAETLFENSTQQFPSEIAGAALLGDEVFVLCSDGLRKWNLASGQVSNLLVGGNFTAIGIDEANSYIYLAGASGLEAYSTSGNPIHTLPNTFTGTVKFIAFWYNK